MVAFNPFDYDQKLLGRKLPTDDRNWAQDIPQLVENLDFTDLPSGKIFSSGLKSGNDCCNLKR